MRSCLLLAATLVGLVFNAGVTHAATLHYATVLSGMAEFPPNPSPGTGNATLTVDTVAQTFLLDFEFSGLTGDTSAAHIHGPTAIPFSGVAGVMTETPSFGGFPVGVTAGSFNRVYDMTASSTWNPVFVAGAGGGSIAATEAAFLASLASGTAYLNIHTSIYGGGEIRGFFSEVTPVPLPAGAVLWLSALAMLSAIRARRRISA